MKTQFGPFVFDRAHQLLAREGHEVPLPPRVLGVLDVLTARPGEIVSRQELMETVWKDAFVSDTSLAEAISFLRQALGDDPQQPSYIQTVHRRGYRFLPPAQPAVAEPTASRPAGESWLILLPWAVAVLLGAIAAAALWRVSHPDLPLAFPIARFEVGLPAGTVLDASAPAVAISADGSRIVFSGCGPSTSLTTGPDGCRLFTRGLDDTSTQALAGTEGGVAPFLSPDGTQVGFFADGKLKKMAATGGTAITIAEVRQPMGAAWPDDDAIVFSGAASGGLGGLSRVAANGATPRLVGDVDARTGEMALTWPDLLPGGRVALATAITGPGDRSRGRIVAVSFATADRTIVLDHASFARFVPPSTIVFVRDGVLMAAAFDPSQLKIVGQPAPTGLRVSDRAPQFAVSRVGAMVAAPLAAAVPSALSWISSDGTNVPLPASLQHLTVAALSGDGRRMAALADDDVRADVWSAEIDRGATTRLTFEGEHLAPISTPDGRGVVFATRVGGAFNLFGRTLDAAAPRRITASARHQTPSSISSDGRAVAYTELDPSTGEDIWMAPLDGGQPSPLIRTRFDESSAVFSPDGRWIAYQSNESNRWEVYVRPLPFAGIDGARGFSRAAMSGAAAIPMSAGGGRLPVWSRDGRTLYYAGPTGVMAVDVRAECGNASEACDVSASKPREIARGPWIPRGAAPDARLLVERVRDWQAADRVTVTLQWTRELQRLVPPAVVATPK